MIFPGYFAISSQPLRGLAVIPEELAPVEAAPLLCGGRTTFTALHNSGALPGDLVAIHGLGGLGHLAVQFARKFGYRTVAISRSKEKEALAYQLGTHYFIDAGTQDAAAELKKLGGGPHHPGDRTQQPGNFRADQWARPGRAADHRGLVERADADIALAVVGRPALCQRLDRPPRQEFLRRHAQVQRECRNRADGGGFSAGTGCPGF
ncbi:MAG: zinc-binding dehydrogenase [Anaerolineales bacterium]